ncbi:MAG: hypothetical protein HYX50_00165 [Chloroflexi bacterium]|nr:hypothetical protein [Chloroflexota bacterium]
MAFSACGGGGTNTTSSTVAAPTAATPRAITGIPELDQVVSAALDADAIRLASLTGYQQVACVKTPPQGPGAPPTCRDTEEDGKSVEVLASTACEGGWVRPENMPDAYRLALEGTPKLVAIFVPRPDPNAFGGNLGVEYVAVLSTGQRGGVNTGAALNIKQGRVVWLQTQCQNVLSLIAPERVQSYVLPPTGVETPAAASPTPAP